MSNTNSSFYAAYNPTLTDTATALGAAAQAEASAEAAATSAASAADALAGLITGAYNNVRLTLASGSPVTTSDIAAATVIYATPCGGNLMAIYNGAQFVLRPFAEIALPLDNNISHSGYHQSGKNFDVFAYFFNGAVVIGTGPGWVSDVDRGTGSDTTELEDFQGSLVNKNIVTVRFGTGSLDIATLGPRSGLYLGSFRTTADGQTTDTKTKRLLFNAYNPARRILLRSDPQTTSSDYSTPAWRLANVNSANQIEVLCALPTAVHLEYEVFVKNSTTTTRQAWFGIGLDSYTPVQGGVCVVGIQATSTKCTFSDVVTAGWHFLSALEYGAGSDVQSWFYTLSGFGFSGLQGDIWC